MSVLRSYQLTAISYQLFKWWHFATFGCRVIHQIIEQPDQAAVLTLLIDPVADQSDRAREDKESVQAVDRESNIDKHRRHRSVHVQNQVVFLHRRDFFHFEREIQTRRLDIQALHIAYQFLYALVRVAEALHAMTDAGHWTMIFLHVGQEVVDCHLVVDRVLEEATCIGYRPAEAGTDHD